MTGTGRRRPAAAGVRAVLRGMTAGQAVAFVVLTVLTAGAVVLAWCAGLVTDVAERLAVAGTAAAVVVRDRQAAGTAARPAGVWGGESA
jgi:hypothetical protein